MADQTIQMKNGSDNAFPVIKDKELIVEIQSKNGVSCAAYNVSDYDFNIVKEGYRFIGCVGFSINAGGACTTVYAILFTNTTFRYRIRNNGSTAVTPTNVVCHFLYIKE